MSRSDISFPIKDAELREDVHMFGTLVGDIIREQAGQALFDRVETARRAAIGWRDGDAQAAQVLDQQTDNIPPEVAQDLVRGFSTWFDVVNMAEKVHRIRRRRQYYNDGTIQPGGIIEAVQRLKDQGLAPEDVRRLMLSMWIEPVFTAHPTESTRRTLLRKQQKVAQLLLSRIGLSSTAMETRVIWNRVRAQITSSWQTADNSRARLTVADEREHVLFFINEVLLRIVPGFYEQIEAALEQVYGAPLSWEVPQILRFASWVGGDMDGNPDVHGKAIRETLARHQQVVVNSYFLECQELAEFLSQSASRIGIDPALAVRIDQYSMLLPAGGRLAPARHDRMPYRVFLAQVMERLRATYDGRANRYESAQEFLDDLLLISASLSNNKGEHAGGFAVRRLIRRVRNFGFHLAALDVRQNALAHRQIIGHGLGEAQWLAFDSATRAQRLRECIERDEGPSTVLEADGRRALWVFEALAHGRLRYGAQAIGPYIVSSTQATEDILAVLLLARWADTADRQSDEVALDIAPMFETAHALGECGQIMTQLFKEPIYRRHLLARGNRQYVMLGYSASNKESGIVASRWSVRQAQEAIVAAADAAGVELTLMHGQADGVDRGGGRTGVLVRSGPPGACRGRLRMTEQGELLNEKYGLRPIALRVLEQAFNAMSLAATQTNQPPLEAGWREAMDQLGQISAATYRATVFDTEDFTAFFAQITPIDVVARMQIGSRPLRRTAEDSVAGLRSIPWAHAWSQCRYFLPGWFGAGTALAQVSQQLGAPLLAQMYQQWFFFTNLIDDIELALARVDLQIAQRYEALVAPQHQHFIAVLRQEFELTCRQVLAIRGGTALLDDDPTVQRSIVLRNPYIDPMHLVQVDLLKRWRAGNREDQELFAALQATVSGISRALQGA